MNGVIDFLMSARSATIREKHSPRSGRSSSPQCKHGTPIAGEVTLNMPAALGYGN